MRVFTNENYTTFSKIIIIKVTHKLQLIRLKL